MVNLNLADAEYQQTKSPLNYKNGLIIIVVMLVILLVGYLVIYLLEQRTDGKITAAHSQYVAEYNKLTSTGNRDIVDFQNRILTAKGLTDQEKAGYGTLPALEQAIVPGVYLKSFDYEQAKAVTVDGVADNFDVLAKQILSFKNSTYFSDISMGATNVDDNGKVEFTLKMTAQ